MFISSTAHPAIVRDTEKTVLIGTQVEEAYGELVTFVASSWELYRAELDGVTFPVFVHCYLTLVEAGYGEQVIDSVSRFDGLVNQLYFEGSVNMKVIALGTFGMCPENKAGFEQGVLKHAKLPLTRQSPQGEYRSPHYTCSHGNSWNRHEIILEIGTR